MDNESKNKERNELESETLTPEEQAEAYAQYLDRLSMPITNVRLLSDEEVEELRREGFI